MSSEDMSRYWRLINTDVENEEYRIHGTWWVSLYHSVKSVDVTVLDKRAHYWRHYVTDNLLGFFNLDGSFELADHMIPEGKRDYALNAHNLLIETMMLAATTPWLPLSEKDETHD